MPGTSRAAAPTIGLSSTNSQASGWLFTSKKSGVKTPGGANSSISGANRNSRVPIQSPAEIAAPAMPSGRLSASQARSRQVAPSRSQVR